MLKNCFISVQRKNTLEILSLLIQGLDLNDVQDVLYSNGEKTKE